MAITTLEKTKKILNVKNKDDAITELIPLVEDWIRGYCNDEYLNEDGSDNFPYGYELIAIKMIEYNLNQKSGTTSESLSRHSMSFADDYPKSIVKGLKRKVSW